MHPANVALFSFWLGGLAATSAYAALEWRRGIGVERYRSLLKFTPARVLSCTALVFIFWPAFLAVLWKSYPNETGPA